MDTRKAAMHVGGICLKVAVFVMIVLFLIYLGQSTYRFSHAVFSDSPLAEEPGTLMKVTVENDVDSSNLAKVLQEKGIIENVNVFKMQMKIHDFADTVSAGTYELSTAMSPSEILAVLSGEILEEEP